MKIFLFVCLVKFVVFPILFPRGSEDTVDVTTRPLQSRVQRELDIRWHPWIYSRTVHVGVVDFSVGLGLKVGRFQPLNEITVHGKSGEREVITLRATLW